MNYRIYPSIGIARLGGHDEFFLGPEAPGQGHRQIQSDGSEQLVTSFKDATHQRIKKQGARFHLFQSEDGQTFTPAELPPGAIISWTVALVNKKSAVTRPDEPPIAPMRPEVPAGSSDLVIDGGVRTIAGPNAVSEKFVGEFRSDYAGGVYSQEVELGQLRTDAQGRLIVLGGNGISGAAAGTNIGNSYYKNPGWFDDVADGPISAKIIFADGSEAEAGGGAWVVVGPPDYAPGIDGIVTMFDVMRQVGISKGEIAEPATVIYDRDIAPLVERARRLRWVHRNATWSQEVLSSPDLRNNQPAFKALREVVSEIILSVESILDGHTDDEGPEFLLRDWQKNVLARWVVGDFNGTNEPADSAVTAAGLTRAALDGAVGQGFCPGIEAGIIITDPGIYRVPFDFRIDQKVLAPGDLTALMAQPWQADFLKCQREWWPSQRPDLAPQIAGNTKYWHRGATTHKGMVENASRLGIIVLQGASDTFVETERDPTLREN